MKRIHALPLAGWMHNPWVEDVLAGKRWHDAYHAPPQTYPHLIAGATVERPDLVPLLNLVSTFIADRLYAIGEVPDVFIHTDLHFRNVVVDEGRVTGLIDFEGSRIGRRDAELDMLFRSLSTENPSSPSRFPGAVAALASVYPELLSDTHLSARLEVYEALWHSCKCITGVLATPGPSTLRPGWTCSSRATLRSGSIG